MKRPETEDNNAPPAKKGFWGSVYNLLSPYFPDPAPAPKLVQVGRILVTEQEAANITRTIQFLEILYFDTNREALLIQNSSPELKEALAELKKEVPNEQWQAEYQRKEEILDKINAMIIRQKIQSSKEIYSKALICRDSFLTRIPAIVFTEEPEYWKQLERLILQDNNLKTLPPQIRQLSALKSLNLLGNDISLLPEEMQELSTLEKVELPKNMVEYCEFNQKPFLPSNTFTKSSLENGVCFESHAVASTILKRRAR